MILELETGKEIQETIYDISEIAPEAKTLKLELYVKTRSDDTSLFFSWMDYDSSDISEAMYEAWCDAPSGTPPELSPGKQLLIEKDFEEKRKHIADVITVSIQSEGDTILELTPPTESILRVSVGEFLTVSLDGTPLWEMLLVIDSDWIGVDEKEYEEYYKAMADSQIKCIDDKACQIQDTSSKDIKISSSKKKNLFDDDIPF